MRDVIASERSCLAVAVVLAVACVVPAAVAGLPAPPVEQWHWDGTIEAPGRIFIGGTCPVGFLTDDDGDGAVTAQDGPNVVIGHGLGSDMSLSVLDGATGATLWRADPSFWFDGAAISVGDVDGGRPEIVTTDRDSLIVFPLDGSPPWQRALPERLSLFSAISLADVDLDGLTDIVVGRCVLLGDGTSWLGTAGRAISALGAGERSLPVELDPSSPGLEILAGNTLYSASGSVLWNNTDLPDAAPAVGDLDGDGAPEIALTSRDGVHVLSAAGVHLASRLGIFDPYGYNPAPVVADITGDEQLEVVVSSTSEIFAFSWSGSDLIELWRRPVRVDNSHPGSTAFDFDCDGAAEVVYRDEDSWYVFDGADGTILHSEPFPSGTANEIPIVANLDDDPWAEIVVPSVGVAVRVYEVPGSATPRRVFNQLTYHVTNVTDDGSIPSPEPPHWESGIGHLAQVAADPLDPCGVGCTGPRPDGLGAVLRVHRAGGEIVVDWPGARPLPPGEHFHLRRAAGSPASLFARVGPDPLPGGSWREPRDPSERLVVYDLRVANPCEEESADEFPSG